MDIYEVFHISYRDLGRLFAILVRGPPSEVNLIRFRVSLPATRMKAVNVFCLTLLRIDI